MRRSTIWPHLLRAATLLIAAILGSLPTAVLAQNASIDARIDAQEARSDAAISTESGAAVSQYAFGVFTTAGGQEKTFAFNVLLPVYYNSNAEAASVNGTRTLETNPEARLSWSKQLMAGLKASALLDFSSDRFAHSNGADTDVAYGKFRLQYVSGGNDQEFQPFVSYSPKQIFFPTFNREKASLQDFIVGFDKLFNFGPGFVPLAGGNTLKNMPPWSFGFTGSFTWRLSDVGPSVDILTATPSITYNISRDTLVPDPTAAQWSASLVLSVSRRWYDPVAGFSRRDWLVNPILTVTFVPPLSWFPGENELERGKLQTSLGGPKIDFQLAAANLDSNKPKASFRQWTIGPIVKAGWTF